MPDAPLSIQEALFGPEHLEVAQSLENLAFNHYLQKKDADMEQLLKRAIVIYERVEGPEQVRANRVKSRLRFIKQKIDWV